MACAAALLMTVIDEVNDDLANGLGFMAETSQAEKAWSYFKELSYRAVAKQDETPAMAGDQLKVEINVVAKKLKVYRGEAAAALDRAFFRRDRKEGTGFGNPTRRR